MVFPSNFEIEFSVIEILNYNEFKICKTIQLFSQKVSIQLIHDIFDKFFILSTYTVLLFFSTPL